MNCNFVGRVRNDDLGATFRRDIIAAGVGFDNPPARFGSPTASSIILVTPDAARSMNTCLGASIEFEAAELDMASGQRQKLFISRAIFSMLYMVLLFLMKLLALRT